MKVYIVLILSFKVFFVCAQTKKLKECDGFWRAAIDSLDVQVKRKEPNYTYILKQLNAYKACNPDASIKVDDKIIEVNNAILKLRDRAVSEKIRADKATKVALQESENLRKEINRTKVLYWVSESDNINPIQGLRLVENAMNINKDIDLLPIINRKIEQLFNNSNTHRYREKYIFDELDFSPNSKFIYGINNNNLNVYNTITNKEIVWLRNSQVLKCFFSINNKWIVILFKNRNFLICNLSTRQQISFTDKKYTFEKFTPNNFAIVKNKNGRITIWDLSTRLPLKYLVNEKNITSIEFSPKKQYLITIHDRNRLCKVWQVSTGKLIHFSNSQVDLKTIQFSNNDSLFICKNLDNKSYVGKMPNGDILFVYDTKSYSNPISFSPDNKWLIIEKRIITNETNEEESYKAWEVIEDHDTLIEKNYEILCYELHELNSNRIIKYKQGQYYLKSYYFLQNNKWLQITYENDSLKRELTADSDWKVESETFTKEILWDLQSDSAISSSYSKQLIGFSSDGKWLLLKNQEEYKLLNSQTNQVIYKDKLKNILSIKFSENGQWLTIHSNTNVLTFWDLKSDLKFNISMDEDYTFDNIVSPDYKWMISLHDDRQAKLWNIKTGKMISELVNNQSINRNYFTFDSNSEWIIYNQFYKKICWQLNLNNIPVYYIANNNLDGLEISPMSSYILPKDVNGNYKILKSSDYREMKIVNSNNIRNITVSPNDKWLIFRDSLYSDKQEYKLFNIDSNKVILQINDYTDSGEEFHKVNLYFSLNSKYFVHQLISLNFHMESDIGSTLYNSDGGLLDLGIGKIYNINFSSNSNLITYFNNNFHIVDLKTKKIPKYIADGLKYKIPRVLGEFPGDTVYVNSDKSVDNIDFARFSPDNKILVLFNQALDEGGYISVWDTDLFKLINFYKVDSTFFQANISPNNKFILLNYGKLIEIRNCFTGEFNKYQIKSNLFFNQINFSNNSDWIALKGNKGKTLIWQISTGRSLDMLFTNNNWDFLEFSPDSKWAVIIDTESREKRLVNLLSNNSRNITSSGGVKFSEDGKFYILIGDHKVTTFDATTGTKLQTLYTNKTISNVQIIESHYINVTAGKAIMQMDILQQKGDFFSYGDGEPLNYTNNEIKEWITVFGNKILLPLSKDVQNKYGIK